MPTFFHIKVGDTVTRMLGGPMPLKVTDLDEEYIYCGPKDQGWKFRRDNGAEVDEYLGWGGVNHNNQCYTGSYLKGE